MKRVFFSIVLAAMLSMSLMVVASANPSRVVVTEEDIVRQVEGTPPTNNWVLYTRNGGTGTFISGPDMPPLGVGSLSLQTPTGADKVWLFNYDYVGTPLSEIDAVSYATYRTAGNASQVTALNIEIDSNGLDVVGGYAVLVFEPVYNTNQGVVTNGTWQSWDAYADGNAQWWSSRPINGVCAFSCYVTWDTILANNPDAVIVGGFGVNQGSGNPGLDAAADALAIGVAGSTVTYDFEPYRVVESKDDCKNRGWEDVRRPDGSPFKNQGDCVSFVASGT